ncbi:diguanylate cyclase domain-containing protein [Psychrobacillus vulpis]|uniref:Diguanylate cyclase n=1 Tax=Psychrobacillus vulpis TaxID=2325572 RepID=A0A544TLT5_9BACI|nr:diguanylate cyclase [Psychrobacillus vulpis]TQR18433.1 diguanylate cyclase [Psychrobacillus vulpis]
MEEQIMVQLKSRILDIWNKNVLIHESSIKWFADLKIILSEFFDVRVANYFIFDADTFLQLQWNHSLTKKLNAIKWLEIEAFFYDKNYAEIPFLQNNHLEYGEVTILLRDIEEQPLGLLTMESTAKWKRFCQTIEVNDFIHTISKLVQAIKKTVFLTQQENQYRNLFNVTKMFHSTLDIGQILEGTLTAIKDAFLNFESSLILSNDQDRKTSAPYKLFDYTSERPATVEAYVSGEITSELATDLGVRLLNVPIKGKQGIYGIMQISTPIDYLFSVRQKEFASLLASAAGNALENAKLYIQSHRLVADLQLINETSHKLNMNLSLDDMLLFLRNQLMKSFHPEQTCFVFIKEEEYEISSASTEFFHTMDGQLYIQHVANHFRKLKDSLFIADFNRLADLKYEYRSLIAIPLREQNNITGFSIVLHKEPYFFSFDGFKLMQSLIQHSSLAISNSILRNKLQEMVNRDHLTNLFARKYLDKYVETSMANEECGVFILMDIDNFKQVNDTHGHQVGDEILKQIATIIEKRTDGIGIGARWGGEELALYLSEMTIAEGIEESKELIKLIPMYTNPSVTVSIGVCVWKKQDNVTFHDLFHCADTALYEAKNNGKNQLRIFEASHL